VNLVAEDNCHTDCRDDSHGQWDFHHHHHNHQQRRNHSSVLVEPVVVVVVVTDFDACEGDRVQV